MPATGEAASGFFAEGWPGGWSGGASGLAVGDGGGAGFAMSPDGGAGAFGGSGRGASAFAAIGGCGADGGATTGSTDGAGTGLALSADGGAGASGGSGRGASAFAAIGGWLGGSGAAMAGSFTNAASGGETSIGGAPESSAGAFRVGRAVRSSRGGAAAASVGFPGAPFSSASLIALRPSNVEDLAPIIAEDLHYASLWRIQESAASVRRLRRFARMRRISRHAQEARRNSSEAFVPPKPNEFDKAILISFSRALCGTRSIVVATEGLSRLRVGGATFACIARIE